MSQNIGKLILIAGRSGSGKTTFSSMLQRAIKSVSKASTVICSDEFYKDYNSEEMKLIQDGNFNYDSFDAFDFERMAECISCLRGGLPYVKSGYSMITHRHDGPRITFEPCVDYYIIEGLFAPAILKLIAEPERIFYMNVDAKTSLLRRAVRDASRVSENLEWTVSYYHKVVEPAFSTILDCLDGFSLTNVEFTSIEDLLASERTISDFLG